MVVISCTGTKAGIRFWSQAFCILQWAGNIYLNVFYSMCKLFAIFLQLCLTLFYVNDRLLTDEKALDISESLTCTEISLSDAWRRDDSVGAVGGSTEKNPKR